MIEIRSAKTEDASDLLEIYRPYVEETPISFELTVPSIEDFANRIETSLSQWAYLVAELDGHPVGYAYGGTHRAREAYRFSVETSVYVAKKYHRQGIARALYIPLLAKLAQLGYANAYAGVTLPNGSSVGFHKSMGFAEIGIFPRVGWKFDQWHDVLWLHRKLRSQAD